MQKKKKLHVMRIYRYKSNLVINLFSSVTDCTISLLLKKAKLIRYSASRPFFPYVVCPVARMHMGSQVFFRKKARYK